MRTLQSSALPLSYLRMMVGPGKLPTAFPPVSFSFSGKVPQILIPEAERSWTCANFRKKTTKDTRSVKVPDLAEKKEKKSKELLFLPDRKTRAESHAIDATRHLYTLQYPVWNLSRLQMIHGSSNLALLCAPRECVWSWPEGYRNFNR